MRLPPFFLKFTKTAKVPAILIYILFSKCTLAFAVAHKSSVWGVNTAKLFIAQKEQPFSDNFRKIRIQKFVKKYCLPEKPFSTVWYVVLLKITIQKQTHGNRKLPTDNAENLQKCRTKIFQSIKRNPNCLHGFAGYYFS